MTRKNTRIEPTLSGESRHVDEQILDQPSAAPMHYNARKTTTKNDTLDTVTHLISTLVLTTTDFCKTKLFVNKKLNIITGVVIGLLFVISILISTLSGESEIVVVEESTTAPANSLNLINRSHKITLPDNFSVLATNYNGMVINWQAETTTEQNLWDIQTAEGDTSCSTLKFNNAEKYRTLNVVVENGQQYFASFSPLDSNKIIKAIALRGNFSLCGYKFSLKGSQAILGKHHYYSEMLSY